MTRNPMLRQNTMLTSHVDELAIIHDLARRHAHQLRQAAICEFRERLIAAGRRMLGWR